MSRWSVERTGRGKLRVNDEQRWDVSIFQIHACCSEQMRAGSQLVKRQWTWRMIQTQRSLTEILLLWLNSKLNWRKKTDGGKKKKSSQTNCAYGCTLLLNTGTLWMTLWHICIQISNMKGDRHITTRACHWRHGHRTHCNVTFTLTLQTYRVQRKDNWWVGSRSDSQTASDS